MNKSDYIIKIIIFYLFMNDKINNVTAKCVYKLT